MDVIPSVSTGSVAVESWVRARRRPWAQTRTTCWAVGFSTPGGRRVTSPSGKAPFWSASLWTAPSTWSNMTALTACTASSSSKTAGCPTCRCWQRKSVSATAWISDHRDVFALPGCAHCTEKWCFQLFYFGISSGHTGLFISQYQRDHFAFSSSFFFKLKNVFFFFLFCRC